MTASTLENEMWLKISGVSPEVKGCIETPHNQWWCTVRGWMRPVSRLAPSTWSLPGATVKPVEPAGWGGGERLGWAHWQPTAQRGPPPVWGKDRRVAKGIVKHSQRFLKDRMPIKFHHFKVPGGGNFINRVKTYGCWLWVTDASQIS